MRVLMRVLVAARLAVERQEHQAPAVEDCHRSSNHQHPEAIAWSRRKGAFDDRIFGQEARKTDSASAECQHR